MPTALDGPLGTRMETTDHEFFVVTLWAVLGERVSSGFQISAFPGTRNERTGSNM